MSVLSSRIPLAPVGRAHPAQPPPLATGPVLAIGGAVALVGLLTSAGYGYLPDELYFLSAGKHLAWSYADQPPLVPLLAHLMDSAFPGSLVALRFPATVLVALAVITTALIAREFGGRRRAQVLAAGAHAISPVIISQGHHLLTTTVDWSLCTVLCWLLVRWVRTRADRLWLAIAVVSAIELQTKYLLVFFWLAAAAALLCVGPREVFRRPWVLAAAGIVAAACVPALGWQATHGWPQLGMNAVISGNVDANGGRLAFLPLVIGYAGLAGGALFGLGLWQLLRADWLRPYRFLGWTTVLLVVFFLLTDGRPYYVAGLYGECWAAGAVWLDRRDPGRWWRWLPTWPAYLASLAIIVRGVVPLPAGPGEPDGYLVTLVTDDWPGLAGEVATVYRDLPADQRTGAVLFANSYAQAGSLDRFGPGLGLPPVYSNSLGYWYFGPPPDSAHTIIAVGELPDAVRARCGELRELGVYHTRTSNGSAIPVSLCSGIRSTWSTLWPKLRTV